MMKRSTRILAIAVILFAVTLPVVAQKYLEFNRTIDSVLTVKYWRADIDTSYITRPNTKWTLIGRLNMAGARIMPEGQIDGMHFKTRLTADFKTTLSVGVSYLGMSVNLAINPAKLLGKYKDYELGFRSYGKRFGYDIAYQDARNFKGWQDIDGVRHDITTSDDKFKLRTLNVNAYYVFNSRRFSYPAALAYSYLQRRSAGSFLLAASGQGQHGNVKGSENGMGGNEQTINFKMTNIGIGAGYGYNYVPSKVWLLHFSSLPTLIVYNKTSFTIGDTRIPLNYHFPELIITARMAFVRQIGSNKFTGLSMNYNFTRIGDDEKLAVRNQKWLARLYFGFRL